MTGGPTSERCRYCGGNRITCGCPQFDRDTRPPADDTEGKAMNDVWGGLPLKPFVKREGNIVTLADGREIDLRECERVTGVDGDTLICAYIAPGGRMLILDEPVTYPSDA